MAADQESYQKVASRDGRRWNRRLWGLSIGILAVSVALFLLVALKPRKEPEPEKSKLKNVEVITVAAAPYTESLNLPARIEAEQHGVISAEIQGRIKAWLVKEGQRVEKGQTLVTLETDSLDAALDLAKAALKAAQSAAILAEKQKDRAALAVEQAKQENDAASARRQAAQSDYELAAKERKRIQSLHDENVTSLTQLDAAKNRFAQAQAAFDIAGDQVESTNLAVQSATLQVSEAEAALAAAQSDRAAAAERVRGAALDVGKTSIKAPFAGRLDKHLAEAGDTVAAQMPLAHLYSLDYVRAVVDVADRYIPFLDHRNKLISEYIAMTLSGAEQAIKARLVLPGLPDLSGKTHGRVELNAEVQRIGLASDPLSNTFQVELKAQNPGEALKPGMIASAIIEYLVFSEAITVPLRAIRVAETGPNVMVVGMKERQEVALVRRITPISIQDNQVLIAQGIKPGDQVIVSGAKGLVNGQAVNVLIRDGEQVEAVGKTSSAGKATAKQSKTDGTSS